MRATAPATPPARAPRSPASTFPGLRRQLAWQVSSRPGSGSGGIQAASTFASVAGDDALGSARAVRSSSDRAGGGGNHLQVCFGSHGW